MKELKLIGTTITTKIDDEYFDELSKITWYYHQNKYTCHLRGDLTIYLHRLIMAAGKGEVVDHIDGDGLNNQKANLRLCTQVKNGQNRKKNKNNTSGFKGVSNIAGHRYLAKPWRANLRFNGVTKNLGNYATPEEAAQAYNNAVIANLDAYAYLNPV